MAESVVLVHRVAVTKPQARENFRKFYSRTAHMQEHHAGVNVQPLGSTAELWNTARGKNDSYSAC